MKVHLHQIPEGDTLHIEGEENPSALGLEEAGATPVSQLRYSLDVGCSGGGLFATGELSITVRMTCVVCLEEFDQEIVISPFALQLDELQGELIDLTPLAREDIHLSLPAHPRCDSGGERICPASRNMAPGPAWHSSSTPASAWEALDKLKSKSK
jgi:uncharacterized metal-binding protein YceD (DUF177 family)